MHSMMHEPVNSAKGGAAQETRGQVMNLGWRYDLMVAALDILLFRGRLRKLPLRAIELADVRPGERVLDVGCGTGTLALLAKERVTESGQVAGIDPGERQIRRARAKAERKGVKVDFRVGVIERLEFPDRSFDVVFSTLMMHHLPDDIKRKGLQEIARVLKPGGRVLIVDFKRKEKQGKPLGEGTIGIQDQPEFLEPAGFSEIESGDIPLPKIPGLQGIGYVRGTQERESGTRIEA